MTPPVPEWAASEDDDSEDGWALECIRDGVALGERELGVKNRWLIGRAADAVDLELAHPSISRVHAVLQRSVEGKWYVADWSANGTRLNKASCPRGK